MCNSQMTSQSKSHWTSTQSWLIFASLCLSHSGLVTRQREHSRQEFLTRSSPRVCDCQVACRSKSHWMSTHGCDILASLCLSHPGLVTRQRGHSREGIFNEGFSPGVQFSGAKPKQVAPGEYIPLRFFCFA